MKRDLDLVRSLLLKCEESPERIFDIGRHDWTDHDMRERQLIVRDWDDDEVFHLDLLTQAGFIKRSVCEHSDVEVFEITWAGYDYLDAVRDEGVWTRTKGVVANAGGSLAIDVIKSVAISVAKDQIKKHTGLEL